MKNNWAVKKNNNSIIIPDTRVVLTEKAPFYVVEIPILYNCENIEKEDLILVRKCNSVKEVLNGLTKGFSIKEKKIQQKKILERTNLNPSSFYIIISSFFKNEIGKVTRVNRYTKKHYIFKWKN